MTNFNQQLRSKQPIITTDLKLHVEDAAGRVHELEVLVNCGDYPIVHMDGDNIMLLDVLRRALAVVEQREQALF